MISKKMEKALNAQINLEMYSSYIYLAMAADFEAKNLNGAATWMHKQAGEEWEHAMRIFKFINERGGRVTLQKIDVPPSDWDTPLGAFEDAYKHEQLVTKKISELVNQAQVEKDHATVSMLQWFVNEQVEEESSVSAIVEKLKLVGDQGGGLFMIDRELGMRQ